MAQNENELKYLQPIGKAVPFQVKTPRVKSIDTATGVYKDVELVTDIPEHMKAWNYEPYVGLKFSSGETMWVNVSFIISLEYDERKEKTAHE